MNSINFDVSTVRNKFEQVENSFDLEKTNANKHYYLHIENKKVTLTVHKSQAASFQEVTQLVADILKNDQVDSIDKAKILKSYEVITNHFDKKSWIRGVLERIFGPSHRTMQVAIARFLIAQYKPVELPKVESSLLTRAHQQPATLESDTVERVKLLSSKVAVYQAANEAKPDRAEKEQVQSSQITPPKLAASAPISKEKLIENGPISKERFKEVCMAELKRLVDLDAWWGNDDAWNMNDYEPFLEKFNTNFEKAENGKELAKQTIELICDERAYLKRLGPMIKVCLRYCEPSDLVMKYDYRLALNENFALKRL